MEKSSNLDIPPDVFQESINGKRITFVGVTHMPDYFSKYNSIFEKVVEENQIIIPEYLPSEVGYDNENTGDEDPDGIKFYGMIARAVAENRRDLVMIDPHTNGGLDVISVSLQSIGTVVFFGSSIDLPVNLLTRKLTRRVFLKNTLLGALGFSTMGIPFTFIHPIQMVSEQLTPRMRFDPNLIDAATLSGFDYRNQSVSKGLNKLTQILPEEVTNLAVIYGAYHTRMIADYTKNYSLSREVKKALYTPFGLVGDESIREYTRVNETWILKNRIPY